MLKVSIEERIKAAMQRYEKWWIKAYTGGAIKSLERTFYNRVGSSVGSAAYFKGGGRNG